MSDDDIEMNEDKRYRVKFDDLPVELGSGTKYDFEDDIGGVPHKNTLHHAIKNKDALNDFLQKGLLKDKSTVEFKPGDSLIFGKGKTFYMMGGVTNGDTALNAVTFVFDGTIKFTERFTAKLYWPRKPPKDGDGCCNGCCECCLHFQHCFFWSNLTNVLFTSTTRPKLVPPSDRISSPCCGGCCGGSSCCDGCCGGSAPEPAVIATEDDGDLKMPNASLHFDGNGNGGIIDGSGGFWYGYLRYVWRQENRPMLFRFDNCENMKVENIEFKNSPYWTFVGNTVEKLEISFCRVYCRRKSLCWNPHSMYELGAFNTDGFEIIGKSSYVYGHDLEVWNQDDCVVMKSGHDMTFERIRASGMGLTIGSIGANAQHTDVTVKNIIFYDCHMEETSKGIYIKFRDIDPDYATTVKVCNVLYKKITMKKPGCAIWIGGAQQSDSVCFWQGHPVSLLWPACACCSCIKCNPGLGKFENISLEDITIDSPDTDSTEGIGVVMGSTVNPMTNVKFTNVRVTNFDQKKKDQCFYYTGTDTNGISLTRSSPGDITFMNCEALGSTWPVPNGFVNHAIGSDPGDANEARALEIESVESC